MRDEGVKPVSRPGQTDAFVPLFFLWLDDGQTGSLPPRGLLLDSFRIADHPGVIGIVTRTEMRYLKLLVLVFPISADVGRFVNFRIRVLCLLFQLLECETSHAFLPARFYSG